MTPNTTTATPPEQNGFFFDFAGLNLLLVVIYGSIIAVMIVVFVKRLILRVSFSQEKPEPGHGGSKSKKNEINSKLDGLIHFAYEPTLLPVNEVTMDADGNPDTTYFYRMKAVDSFQQIDEALLLANTELRRPMGKSVRQHLIDAKSHSSGCLRSVRTNQLNAFSEMYLHARCRPERFGEEEYKKYFDLGSELVSVLRHRTHRRKLKERKKEFYRQTALTIDTSDNEETRPPGFEYQTTRLIEKTRDAISESQDQDSPLPSPTIPLSDIQPLLPSSSEVKI